MLCDCGIFLVSLFVCLYSELLNDNLQPTRHTLPIFRTRQKLSFAATDQNMFWQGSLNIFINLFTFYFLLLLCFLFGLTYISVQFPLNDFSAW